MVTATVFFASLAVCSGIEEQLSLDAIDLTELYEGWDVPLGPDFNQVERPSMDLPMEVDTMRQQLHRHEMESEFVEMPRYDAGPPLSAPGQESYEAQIPYNPPPLAPQHTMSEFDTSQTYPDHRSMMHPMEQRGTPEMDVQRPRINLVLDSNVVMLDSRACPKPAVTILPSQVIRAPDHPAICDMSECLSGEAPCQRAGFLGGSSAQTIQGYPCNAMNCTDFSWSHSDTPMQPHHPQGYYNNAPPMYDMRHSTDYNQNIQSMCRPLTDALHSVLLYP